MHHFILPTTASLPCLRRVNVAAKVLAWLTVRVRRMSLRLTLLPYAFSSSRGTHIHTDIV